ncbi:VOC family protein [Flavisphingomonas formosensis]|uniref:VOC family protein n=1 Tax=Flavisphingomonas formosensis TaxID=861534 RepID=UPI0012F98A26|nr:lactoylglutathione lyase [Sphingomonas formosensis]
MPKMIFLNLPVADVAKSAAFYEAIGAVHDTSFCKGPEAAMLVWSDTISFMLLDHARFADFAPKPIADAHRTNEMLICLSLDSREAVDAITEAAIAAGGKGDPSPVDDHGFMYGRSFEDLDGHCFGPMWMDVAAAMAAQAEPAAA